MAETDLKNFNCEAFAKDLASQASQVVPNDIPKADKDFIVEIIYRFCKIAGDALVKEENSKLNASQASLITQFIGEWIFHKSVDIIRAKIEPKFREGILQKVASCNRNVQYIHSFLSDKQKAGLSFLYLRNIFIVRKTNPHNSRL